MSHDLHAETYFKQMKNTKITIKAANRSFDVIELIQAFTRKSAGQTVLWGTRNIMSFLTCTSCCTSYFKYDWLHNKIYEQNVLSPVKLYGRFGPLIPIASSVN